MLKRPVNLLLAVYLMMLVVIFVLPNYSTEGYSILKHTTSQLAAQKTPNAWIMNIIFILLGVSTIYSGWFTLKRFLFHRIVLTGFGSALILTAFFRHAPIDPDLTFNEHSDSIHSIAATVTGICFTLFAVSSAFILTARPNRFLAIFMAVLATGLSFLMFQIDVYAGIWQRLIFITSFAWLIFIFHTDAFKK